MTNTIEQAVSKVKFRGRNTAADPSNGGDLADVIDRSVANRRYDRLS